MTAAIDVDSLFATALHAHSLGDVARALAGYQETLAVAPRHAKANANLGTIYLSQLRLHEAIDCYRRALEADPGLQGVHGPLGMALSVCGEHQPACRHLERALRSAPDDADINFHLAESYLAVGRRTRALACYRAALSANPEHGDAARALAILLKDADRPGAEALHRLREARRLRPDDLEIAGYLGKMLLELQHDDEALRLYQDLARLAPEAPFLNNLALAQIRTGDIPGAIATLKAALERYPHYANGWNTLGTIYCNMRATDEAQVAFERVIALAPDEPDGYINLANCYLQREERRQALECVAQALDRCPPLPAKLLVIAGHLESFELFEPALEIYRRVLEIDPTDQRAPARLLNQTLAFCDWSDYDGLVESTLQRVRQDIAANRQLRFVIFNLLALPVSHDFVFDVCRHQSACLAADVKARASLTAPFVHARRGRERIRLGYALPYTFFHSMPLVLKEIVRNHDRSRFEVYGYSITPSDGTSFNDEFRGAFDHFAELAGSNPIACARAIHADEIDILVDTTGQTPITCLPVMSLRPAPVQVHAIGFGLSTGADYIDYLISDRTFMPPECQSLCSERLIHMPDCFLPAFVPEESAEATTRAEHGLPDDAVVFMNFNEPLKFEPQMFTVWMRILSAVPGSVLWLGRWSSLTTTNLRREAEARGVDGGRLIFAPFVKHRQHFSRLPLADIALDNRLHGGGITSIDALTAGVPLLTLRGDTPQSRLGATLSRAVGASDLVVNSIEEYERTAIALARDPARRKALRDRLVSSRATAPLFDVARYRRHLEAAYRIMWDIHQRGEPPRGFDVPPQD